MSPAKNAIDPTSRRSRIRLFLATNPGGHRPAVVAKALDDDYLMVANEMRRMAKAGALTTTEVLPEGRRRPDTFYTLNMTQED